VRPEAVSWWGDGCHGGRFRGPRLLADENSTARLNTQTRHNSDFSRQRSPPNFTRYVKIEQFQLNKGRYCILRRAYSDERWLCYRSEFSRLGDCVL
jgi:hypothetical protein